MLTISTSDDIGNKYSYMTEEKKLWKRYILYFPKRTCNNCNWFWKKKTLPLTEKELKLHQDSTVYYICSKIFGQRFAINKNH